MTNKSSAIDILCMGIFSLVRFRHPYLGEYSRFVNLSFHISRIKYLRVKYHYELHNIDFYKGPGSASG
jgi:hypothetical protein